MPSYQGFLLPLKRYREGGREKCGADYLQLLLLLFDNHQSSKNFNGWGNHLFCRHWKVTTLILIMSLFLSLVFQPPCFLSKSPFRFQKQVSPLRNWPVVLVVWTHSISVSMQTTRKPVRVFLPSGRCTQSPFNESLVFDEHKWCKGGRTDHQGIPGTLRGGKKRKEHFFLNWPQRRCFSIHFILSYYFCLLRKSCAPATARGIKRFCRHFSPIKRIRKEKKKKLSCHRD